MPASKVVAEFVGAGTEHLGGIPASDLTQEQMDALSDEQRAALLANAAGDHAIYKLHGRDIKAEARDVAEAAERVERAEPAPMATDAVPPAPDKPAPKAEAKKP